MELVRVNEMLPDVEAIECSLRQVSGQTLYFTTIENAFRTRATPLPSMLPTADDLFAPQLISPNPALPALSRVVTDQTFAHQRERRYDR